MTAIIYRGLIVLVAFELILLVALVLYWVWNFWHDYACYEMCIKDILVTQELFMLTECIVEVEEDGTYDYVLKYSETLPAKRIEDRIIAFQNFFDEGIIVSLEEEGKSFIPYFNLDNLLKEMTVILVGSKTLLEEDYHEQDFLAKWLLRKKYENLKKYYPKFDKIYKDFSKVKPGTVFRMNIGCQQEGEHA